MSLYQKHRPTELKDVVGNSAVIESLRSQLEVPKDMPHAFLFHGPTGCGKTTLARIIAKELGCKGDNIVEIDTAQFRGIDTVRDMAKKAQYVTLNGPVRTYIIDEVHSATRDAQNAMLKILEDTPPHIFFILCTTDPQKLLPTIRGRCNIYQVSRISDKDMTKLITRVVKKEKIKKLDDLVVRSIVESALGHPRNALTILEKVIKASPKKQLKIAKEEAENQNASIDLCRALGKGNWKQVSSILKGLKGEDPEDIRRAVLGYATSVLLNGNNETYARILEEFAEPTYNSGFPQIVLASHNVLHLE